MKDSEEAIEKVLAGLRNCDAPEGMERRILEVVQKRVSAESRSGWRRSIMRTPLIATGYVACGVVLAGIFAFVLAIPSVHRRELAPVQSKKHAASLAPPPVASSGAVAEIEQPPVPLRTTRPREANVRRAGLVRSEESIALREMRAASRPEPPMPLTEQEKLLLRFVQTRSPEELAAVDPGKWAVQDAEERAEFEKFFKHQRTGDSE